MAQVKPLSHIFLDYECKYIIYKLPVIIFFHIFLCSLHCIKSAKWFPFQFIRTFFSLILWLFYIKIINKQYPLTKIYFGRCCRWPNRWRHSRWTWRSLRPNTRMTSGRTRSSGSASRKCVPPLGSTHWLVSLSVCLLQVICFCKGPPLGLVVPLSVCYMLPYLYKSSNLYCFCSQ